LYLCLNNRVFECTNADTCFAFADKAAFETAFVADPAAVGFQVVPGKQPEKVKEFEEKYPQCLSSSAP